MKPFLQRRGLVLAVMLVALVLTAVYPAALLALPLFTGTTLADIVTTRSDPDEINKQVYLMARDLIPESSVILAQLKKTRRFKAAPDGLRFNVKLETGGAVANVRDGGVMPRESRGQRRQGLVGLAHTYATMAIGGQAIPLQTAGRNAFVSQLEEQFEDAMFRTAIDVERQYNGDGTGILCRVLTVAGAPTYGVERPYGFQHGGKGTMLLIEDMDVAVINPGTGAERGRATITAINPDTDEVTLSASVAGTAIGDYLVLANRVDAAVADRENNYQNEANGISAWTKSGDVFEGINGSDFKRWNATVLSNAGVLRPVTERLVADMEARIKTRSGKRPTLHYTSAGISLNLQETLHELRRFTGETVKMQGGFEGLKIGARTVVEGDMVAKGRWYGLHLSEGVVGQADLVAAGFVDLDGARLSRLPNRHAYGAIYWFPHNALVFERACHGVILDLQDDNGITR